MLMLNVLMPAYDRIGARTENFTAMKLFQKDTILKLQYSTSVYHR